MDENSITQFEQAADVSGAVEGAGTPDVQATEVVTETTGLESPPEVMGDTPPAEPERNPYDSPPADDRIQHLANKTRELEERLVRQQEEREAQQPQYANDEQIRDVKRQMALAVNKVAELQEEIRLDPDNASEAAMELVDLQNRMNSAYQWMQDQGRKKVEFETSRKMAQENTQRSTMLNQQLNSAAELVRLDRNVTPEVWNKAAGWFMEQREAKPLLEAKYQEIITKQGPVAAVEWAESYVRTNMGLQFQQATQQKEAAKNNIPAGKSGTETSFVSSEEARMRGMYPSMFK
jgi:hypothetical protein